MQQKLNDLYCETWKKRYLLRRAPGGKLGSNFKKQSLPAISTQGPLTYYTLGRSLPWTACLTVSAIWASSYGGVPGILFQPMGLRPSPLQSELHSYILINMSTNQAQQLIYNQSGKCLLDQSNYEDLKSSFAWGQTNQGPEQRLLWYQPAPLWLWACTLPSTKD